MTSSGDVTVREMPPEMAPASESTSALRICDGSSPEAIGGGGAGGGWAGLAFGKEAVSLLGPRRVAWWCGVWLKDGEAPPTCLFPRPRLDHTCSNRLSDPRVMGTIFFTCE
jgi:hypothetical protein